VQGKSRADTPVDEISLENFSLEGNAETEVFDESGNTV
jgi:hypothetical protein